MGTLQKNEDGTYSIVGGFSTKNPEDMKLLTDNFGIQGLNPVEKEE